MMKKILWFVISFLMFTPVAFADYTITQNAGSDDPGASFGLNDGGNGYRSQSFTTIGAGTVASVKIHIAKRGSFTGHVIIMIYTDSSGKPGTQVGASSNNYDPTVTYTASAPFSSLDTVTFPTPPAVSASTKYWVVYNRTNGLQSDPNGFTIDVGDFTGGDIATSQDLSSWTNGSRAYNAQVNITTAVAIPANFGRLTFFGWF